MRTGPVTEAMTTYANTDPNRCATSDIGGREFEIGTVRVVAAGVDAPPFAVDMLVLEQDTYLLMVDDGTICEPPEPLTALADELPRQPALNGGTVIVRESRPMQLLAVVHDIEREPTWSEQWITLALDNIVTECIRHDIESIAMRPMAYRHGGFPIDRFIKLLRNALTQPTGDLRRVWLVWPSSHHPSVPGTAFT